MNKSGQIKLANIIREQKRSVALAHQLDRLIQIQQHHDSKSLDAVIKARARQLNRVYMPDASMFPVPMLEAWVGRDIPIGIVNVDMA